VGGADRRRRGARRLPGRQPGAYPAEAPGLTQLAPVLVEVRQVGDFEGIVNLAVGLSREVCPTVSVLGDPSRLVLKFPTT